MWFSFPSDPAPVQPDILFNLFGLDFTNAMLFGVIVTIGITIFSLIVTNRAKLLPNKLQIMIEAFVESSLNLLEQILGGKKAARHLLPLIGAIFVFFGVSNLIGLIPGLTSFTYNGVPLLRTPTNDFNMTFAVALAMVLLTQYMSLVTFGPIGHLEKYFKFRELFMSYKKGIKGVMFALIDFMIALLDIVSEVAKVFSLSLRLFGNMYAGEILMSVLLGAFAVAIPSVWLAMNLLVGLLQAMVFGALTAAYYALAIEKPVEEEA